MKFNTEAQLPMQIRCKLIHTSESKTNIFIQRYYEFKFLFSQVNQNVRLVLE